MKVFIYDGTEYDEMPAFIWPDTSPIIDRWFIEHGGRIETRPDPPEPTPVVQYSKLKILAILASFQITPAYENDLVSASYSLSEWFITSMQELGVYIYWDAATLISSDYPQLLDIYDSIMKRIRDYYYSVLVHTYPAWTHEHCDEVAGQWIKTIEPEVYNRIRTEAIYE